MVVLFLHWGKEYSSITDTGVIGIVKNLTKSANIDLIVGSHPHVTQKHWYTGKTLVATSLGNLLFMPYNLANFVSSFFDTIVVLLFIIVAIFLLYRMYNTHSIQINYDHLK